MAFEASKGLEAHFENRFTLFFGEFEFGHQLFEGFFFGFGFANRGDDVVDVVEGDFEAFEDVSAGQSDFEVVFGAASDDDFAVFNEVFKDLFEVEELRLDFVHERNHVHVESGLELSEFEKLVEDLFRIGVFF